MLASMEKLAIFKSGFQMQNIEVNTGLRGGGNWCAGLALVAKGGVAAIPAKHGELISGIWYYSAA